MLGYPLEQLAHGEKRLIEWYKGLYRLSTGRTVKSNLFRKAVVSF